jgi:hypothetical protein
MPNPGSANKADPPVCGVDSRPTVEPPTNERRWKAIVLPSQENLNVQMLDSDISSRSLCAFGTKEDVRWSATRLEPLEPRHNVPTGHKAGHTVPQKKQGRGRKAPDVMMTQEARIQGSSPNRAKERGPQIT